MASRAIPVCGGHCNRVECVMIPGPDKVTRKFPVLVPENLSEKTPLASVDTVAVEVATEMAASPCPPFVAVTLPEKFDKAGVGVGAGVAGAGGAEGKSR